MLSAEREQRILSLLQEQGIVTVKDLAERFDVTDVTIRRDLQRLESMSLLRRTHGGAVSSQPVSDAVVRTVMLSSDNTAGVEVDSDALIIGPVNTRSAHTLRERAVRNGIPFFAESCPQDGAIYLGARNFEAGQELGIWTGHAIIESGLDYRFILDITQNDLSNTRERSQGFKEGIWQTLSGSIEIVSVDGKALYETSYRVALDALRMQPDIHVIFGINDDSILAGIQAYLDLGYDATHLMAVNIGGEGSTIFNVLHNPGPLKACMALFPEIVGRLGVDATCYLWSGRKIDTDIYTPHRLLTPGTLTNYYQQTRQGWQLREDRLPELIDEHWLQSPSRVFDKQLAFVIHYRTHEWYQNVAAAMDERARQLGVRVAVQDVNADVKAEIRELRRLIGKLAASYVNDGDTIILDAGSTTANMAPFLIGIKDLTVITNSIEVFSKLRHNHNIDILMTGGEYDPDANAFVGRGSHLFLDEIRADKVFLVAGGISIDFGVSSVQIHEAEIRRHMVRAARQVIVLADHTIIGVDARAKVIDLEDVDTIITDAGILAQHSLVLSQMGIEVIVAGKVT